MRRYVWLDTWPLPTMNLVLLNTKSETKHENVTVQAENQYNIHIENLWTPTAVEKDNNKLAKLLHIQFSHTIIFTKYFPCYNDKIEDLCTKFQKTKTTIHVSNSIKL